MSGKPKKTVPGSPKATISQLSTHNGKRRTSQIRVLPTHVRRDKGPKKLFIQGLSAPGTVTLPKDYEEEGLEFLKEAVQAVYKSKPAKKTLEELYGIVEALCTAQRGKGVYKMVCSEVVTHVGDVAKALVSQTEQSETLLQVIDKCWATHTHHMMLINSIFLCLDRKYVLPSPSITSLWDLGLALFRKEIVNQPILRDRMIARLIMLINRERDDRSIDRGIVRNICDMFSCLTMYTSFQTAFLEATQEYYAVEGRRLVTTLTVPEYLQYISKRMQQEQSRIEDYLHTDTWVPVCAIMRQELLKTHVSELLEKGFHAMVKDSKLDELKMLYRLLSTVDALEDLKVHFITYLRAACSEMVLDEARDSSMVVDLLVLRSKIDTILEKSFGNQEKLRNACKDAFEATINARPNKPAELVAKFIDRKLRAGYKNTTEGELDELLDDVMALFRLIHGKDVFEAFYKKDLARRLLVQRSASVDAERSMLTKLKQECGPRFTQNLEGMFKDIDVSKDIMQAYNETRDRHASVDLEVVVLTEGQWPSYPSTEGLVIPRELQDVLEPFKTNYCTKNKGRILTWLPIMGQCIMRANFKQTKELEISMHQAFVLLLLNKNDKLTIGQVQQHTGLGTVELERVLLSLACGKKNTRVLLKTPKSDSVAATDVFTVNEKFDNKLRRVKILQIQLKETIDEQRATQEQVFQDRQHQVDACIVRIMKTRKTMGHQLLIGAILEILKLPIKPTDLKKRIESLIDREYLERDENDSTKYHYMA